MEGEFLVEERFGIVEGVGGGNIIILAEDVATALGAAEAAAEAMRAVEGAIMPFPGGIARSGSKVGSRYTALMASTNHVLCPTLRAQADDTQVPDGHRLGVRDRDRRARARAGRRGDAGRPRGGGAGGRAADHGGQLRRQPRRRTTSRSRTSCRDADADAARGAGRAGRADALRPDRLAALSAAEIERL